MVCCANQRQLTGRKQRTQSELANRILNWIQIKSVQSTSGDRLECNHRMDFTIVCDNGTQNPDLNG